MERITVTSMTHEECSREFADRLDIEPIDIDHITNKGNSGNCYTFTATDSTGRTFTGSAYMDLDFVAVESGGDPVWYQATEATHDDDETALNLALNGEITDA